MEVNHLIDGAIASFNNLERSYLNEGCLSSAAETAALRRRFVELAEHLVADLQSRR